MKKLITFITKWWPKVTKREYIRRLEDDLDECEKLYKKSKKDLYLARKTNAEYKTKSIKWNKQRHALETELKKARATILSLRDIEIKSTELTISEDAVAELRKKTALKMSKEKNKK